MFKNLLVNHTTKNFSKYRQFTLTFSANGTANLSATFINDIKI